MPKLIIYLVDTLDRLRKFKTVIWFVLNITMQLNKFAKKGNLSFRRSVGTYLGIVHVIYFWILPNKYLWVHLYLPFAMWSLSVIENVFFSVLSSYWMSKKRKQEVGSFGQKYTPFWEIRCIFPLYSSPYPILPFYGNEDENEALVIIKTCKRHASPQKFSVTQKFSLQQFNTIAFVTLRL